MQELPTGWSALCALVFLLGLRHGFDADHLAAIDGLTRYNTRRQRPFARYCGLLFSLGHGVVVLAVALAVVLASTRWSTPAWLELAGAWLSIGLLTLIGVLNLRMVLAARPDEPSALVGVKGRWFGGLLRAGRPLTVALVGSVFAISFDTISQAALFAFTALQHGGLVDATLLALLFAAGMVVTDAVNGLWVSKLIARADHIAVIASRIMGLAVSGVSLLVAAYGAARLVAPAMERWSDRVELLPGAIVCALILASYLAARLAARQRVVGEPPGA